MELNSCERRRNACTPNVAAATETLSLCTSSQAQPHTGYYLEKAKNKLIFLKNYNLVSLAKQLINNEY